MIDKELADRIAVAVYGAEQLAESLQNKIEQLHLLHQEARAKADQPIPADEAIARRLSKADDHSSAVIGALESMHRAIRRAAPAFGYEATPPNEPMGRMAGSLATSPVE